MLNESGRGRLVRILRKIKRKRGDGSMGTHEQAFHVRQASPGDRYAQTQRPQPDMPSMPDQQGTPQEMDPGLDPGMDPAMDPNTMPVEEPVEFRLEVHPLQMPWLLAGDGGDKDIGDPVPAEIRKRFDPNNKSTRHRDPIKSNVPVFAVKPGEDLLWIGVEGELLNRLRGGIVVATRPSSSAGQAFLSKIESTDGIVERAYLRFDKLINQQVFDLYHEMYGLKSDDGSMSRRAAAAYELAKGAGFDDLVPPTVFRFDEHSGLEPILSTKASEELADSLGVSIEALRAKMGDSASVELWSDDLTMFWEQPWYQNVSALNADGLNEFYARLEQDAPDVRVALLRGAVFDFLVWNGNRTWADVMFCPEPRHPVHLVRNEMTFPDPVAMGTAYIDYMRSYHDGCPDNLQYMPMLWSDLVSMAAMRGYESDARMYEDIAVEVVRRLRGQRLTETLRSLADHGVPLRNVAATLVRVYFLRYGYSVVMRNPLVVAEYFSSLMTGSAFDPGFDIDLDAMEEEVDAAMKSISMSDFSLRAAMEEDEDDQ